jgi:hypothetical protein
MNREGNPMASEVTTAAQAPAAFSYEALPVEQATELQQLAASIRTLGRKQIDAMIEIGTKLVVAQKELPHGQFIPWISTELDMKYRTAVNYMHLAGLAADKPEIISHLPPTAGYLIAAPETPESVKDAVVSRIRSGEVVKVDDIKRIVRAAKAEVAEAKRAERNARRRAKLSPERRKAEDELKELGRKRAEREEAQRENEARERAERCEQAAAMLRARLGEDPDAFLELAAPKGSNPLVDRELLEHLQ